MISSVLSPKSTAARGPSCRASDKHRRGCHCWPIVKRGRRRPRHIVQAIAGRIPGGRPVPRPPRNAIGSVVAINGWDISVYVFETLVWICSASRLLPGGLLDRREPHPIQSPALWLTLTSGPGACPPGANQPRYVESIVSYEVPYKIAYFEGDRCTGWEYLTR
jgi:hypothetical protein